jgi:DNA mismatch repair protein MutL
MTAKIQQLSPTLVNQIAAGEVIERPASVVKELLENALDAKADHIVVELSFGGMNSIIVSDNGVGIAHEELPLAIAAHATSKIQHFDDLNAIVTMGFRGEALASIASISRFTIQSRPAHQSHAMQLTLEDEKISVSPCARNTGTTVMVQDLFYNTPVRKRFLSSEKAEFLAIDRLVRCFALSDPAIKLDFYHQGNCIFQCPKGDTDASRLHRIQKILGKGFVDKAIPVNTQYSNLTMTGWVAQPDFARSQQDRLWTYVNRRMVNDKLLNHAIKQAYEGKLLPGRFPVCLIYLEINPDAVDVNVHPTKHEIRFHQPRWVHDALMSTVSASISEVQQPIQILDGSRRLGCEAQQSQYAGPAGLHSPAYTFDWITLNANFALLYDASTSYLLDVKRFYRAYLQEQLKTAELPLVSRPLFVPVSISLEKQMLVLEETFVCLTQVGLTLSWLGESVLLVRSIPVMMPHLNLKAFILSVLSMSNLTTEKVVNEMLQHQTLEAGVVSDLEKQTWMAYLSAAMPMQDLPFLRALSTSNCAALFHE